MYTGQNSLLDTRGVDCRLRYRRRPYQRTSSPLGGSLLVGLTIFQPLTLDSDTTIIIFDYAFKTPGLTCSLIDRAPNSIWTIIYGTNYPDAVPERGRNA
jgi:hypothetical protein